MWSGQFQGCCWHVRILSLQLLTMSLLTLDHTTMFFFTLCSPSQHHETSVDQWRTSVATKFNPSSKVSDSIPTPSLVHTSTQSAIMSILKHRSTNDSVIDFSYPTPKKPRTQGPKTTSKVKVVTYVEDDYDSIDHSWLSDKDEIDCPEAVVARLSPLKNGVQVTSSVSNF